MDEFLKDIVDCFNQSTGEHVKNTHEVLDGLEKRKLIADLEYYEEKLFMLKMADHWDDSDYRLSEELHGKILEIKKELKDNYDYIAD